MTVTVRKLVHRGQRASQVRDTIALNHALGTGIPDDRRLVLVRKMTVSGHLKGRAASEEAVRAGWINAVSGAVHGSAEGSRETNCVWFRSPAEAQAVMLRKILLGLPVDAWFWALALPEFQNLPAREFLPCSLGDAIAKPDADLLLALLHTCLELGRSAELVEAFERVSTNAQATPLMRSAVEASDVEQPQSASEEPTRRSAGLLIAKTLKNPTITTLLRLRSVVPATQRTAAVLAQCEAVIIEAALLQVAPALSLNRPMLSRVKALCLKAVQGPAYEVRGALDADRSRPSGHVLEIPSARGNSRSLEARWDKRLEPGQTSRSPSAKKHRDPVVRGPEKAEKVQAETFDRSRSNHGGLWLVIPTLVDLGFREWLADQRDLLCAHPARRLMLAIARHYGVDRTDPCISIFGPVPEEWHVLEDEGWVFLWRIGLDRWLRRTAKRRLHDLIGRPAWLVLGDQSIELQFPVGSADLRLRRLALDRDPGWTDWLGLSVRYRFDGAQPL
ncbi:MAG: hypothetical protein AAF583_00525 [Pseudomonadota bacterium]